MENLNRYPEIRETEINDDFWTPYLAEVEKTMLPYVLERLEGSGYLDNYLNAAGRMTAAQGRKHKGPPFSDGLLLESLRAACDMLAADYDEALAVSVERIAAVIRAASFSSDGFLSTLVMTDAPEHRWGLNGGHLIHQHDIYNQGALIEAAISHYRATGSTLLLDCAVRAANLICSEIGASPKLNIVPGHSLPEEAMVKLYCLFRDDRTLDTYAVKMKVDATAYLEMADFWYKARGNYESRPENPGFSHEYNQDNVTFEAAREAVGHSVRASLCYTGAAAVSRVYGDGRYEEALRALWKNVTGKKMHISGGIGTRHDIEGFDADYALPNNAYLETCAAIGLAFWAAEMNLLSENSEYFDVFERALYNNILDGVGDDFKHFFYQNPLVSEGGISRWEWHGCPCCPPMLLKIYSSIRRYVYSCSKDKLCLNLYIGSNLHTDGLSASFDGKKLTVSSETPRKIKLRIPEYAENFAVTVNGMALNYTTENGYAVIGIYSEAEIGITFTEKLRRVCADPRVKDDAGMVAVMNGKFLMCAEGIDNGGNTDFTVAENPMLTRDGECVIGKRADGGNFRLIPYYKWCRRVTGKPEDDKMAVWFRQENMYDITYKFASERLYEDYE